MKKLWNILVLVLALNFLAAAGGAGWLYQQGKLDRHRLMAIRDVLFPKPASPAPATQPASDVPTTRPALKLEELMAAKAGMSAAQQVQFIQHTFDARMAELDRHRRELAYLKGQIEMARQKLTVDRGQFEKARQQLVDERQLAAKLASNKGFQDSLQLYQTMPSKQVKQIFMSLDDSTMRRYLEAMEPRIAARIIKEFKSPQEVQRIQQVLEMMRLAQTNTTTRN